MGILRLEDLPRYDYDDYKIWEGKWELIDGIPYSMAPSPISAHQDISGNIHIELKEKLKNCKHCKPELAVDWKISNDTVVCPDNSVVCNKTESNFIEDVPQIIFEVLSPSTKKKDRIVKYNIFQEQGAKYYVLVEPKGNFAEVYKLVNGYYKLEGELTDEVYNFKIDNCEIEFQFKNIFEN